MPPKDTPSTPNKGTGAPEESTSAVTEENTPGFLNRYFELTDGGIPNEGEEGDAPADDDGEEAPESADDEDLLLAGDETDEEEDPDDPGEEEEEDKEADEATEDDEEANEEDEQPLFPVKVDGKTKQVTLDELKKGYSRTEVFTQKTQKAAEQRKALDATEAAIAAEREQLAQALTSLVEQETALDPEPNWTELQASDRDEYLFQKQVWADKKEQRAKLVSVQEEMRRRNATQFQEAQARKLEAESTALVEAIPAWSDKARSQKELAQIYKYVRDMGFSEEEAGGVSDHRLVLILRDAARYKKLIAGKNKVSLPAKQGEKKKIKESPKTLKPGRGKSKPTSGSIGKLKAATERLRKSGSPLDAANAFANIPGFLD